MSGCPSVDWHCVYRVCLVPNASWETIQPLMTLNNNKLSLYSTSLKTELTKCFTDRERQSSEQTTGFNMTAKKARLQKCGEFRKRH